MIEKLEFSNFKRVRKTLLITSFAGILFKKIATYSTGNLEFLGFKIPIDEADIIPQFIGYLIIYFCFAFVLRYFDEDFTTKYRSYLKQFEKESRNGNQVDRYEVYERTNNIKGNTIVRKGILIIDVWFPPVLGLIALCIIYIE